MTVSDSEQSEPGPGQELTDSDTENHWGPGAGAHPVASTFFLPQPGLL